MLCYKFTTRLGLLRYGLLIFINKLRDRLLSFLRCLQGQGLRRQAGSGNRLKIPMEDEFGLGVSSGGGGTDRVYTIHPIERSCGKMGS